MAQLTKSLINVCKINTTVFRKLTEDQLFNAKQGFHRKQYPPYMSKAWRARHSLKPAPHDYVLYTFLDSLYTARRNPSESQTAKYEAKAAKLERVIWNLQVKAKCKISPNEMVARDAIEAGDFESAARLRAKKTLRGVSKRRGVK